MPVLPAWGLAIALSAVAANAGAAQAQGQAVDPATTGRGGEAMAQAPDSLDLAGVVRQALERYPAMAAARASRDQARAAVGEARSAWLPAASLDAMVTRFDKPMVVAPIHGFTPGNLPSFDNTLMQGGVSVGYTLWDGGARGARIHRAAAAAAGAEAGLDATEQDVTGRATLAYLRVLTLRDVLQAHDLRRQALESEEARVTQMLHQGKAARVQLLRAQAALSQAAAERQTTASQLELAIRDLGRLLGLSPDQVRAAGLRGVHWSGASPPPRDALLEQARAANPALTKARQSLEAARAGTAEARSRFFPSIGLAARQTEYGNGSGSFTGEWNAGVQVSYALFSGGARLKAMDRASAERRAAEDALSLQELSVQHDVDAALTSLASAQARVRALTAGVAQFEEVARIEHLSLEAGAGVQTDYLTAEAELLQARASLAQARHAVIAAHVELAQAVGELSAGWIERNMESN
jgi:outer membrane protein TolC